VRRRSDGSRRIRGPVLEVEGDARAMSRGYDRQRYQSSSARSRGVTLPLISLTSLTSLTMPLAPPPLTSDVAPGL